MMLKGANRVVELFARDGAHLTDGQLLERYVTQKEQVAFEALVRRHGAMVWSVCRRVLDDHQTAEDAFQATFLVLVRRAASIRPPHAVGNWLYGVAYRTAFKARTIAAKRRAREIPMARLPEAEAPTHDLAADLRGVLDHELSRLADKYRLPVVLCDLEGKTQKEAARQLGWIEGTLSGRLARARAMLAARLMRRGLAFSGTSLALATSQGAASALPPSLVPVVLRVVNLLGTKQEAGLISAEVASLTQGVLKSMFLTKLKQLAALLSIVCVLGAGGAALAAYFLTPEPEPPLSRPTPAQARPAKDKAPSKPEPADKLPERIQPGDRLHIRVPGTLPDHPIQGVFRVEASGKIALGSAYGRVQVNGLSLEEAEERIQKQLAPILRKPAVSVTWYDPASHGPVSADATLERRVQELEGQVRALRSAVEDLKKKR